MDHRKLDARLSEALATGDAYTRFEVFVEISGDAAPDDVERLARFGVQRRHGDETIITATLGRNGLDKVTGVPAVRQVRLSRRLRHP